MRLAPTQADILSTTIQTERKGPRPPEYGDHWTDPDADRLLETVKEQRELIRKAAGGDAVRREFALPGLALRATAWGEEAGGILCLAFEHLECAPGSARGTPFDWHIFDSSGIADLPEPPAPPRPLHPLGNLHRNERNDLLVERRPGLVTTYEAAARRFITIVEGGAAIDTDMAAKPLLRFLLLLTREAGIVMCHAALVGGEERGMMITGRGGAGKSTISSSALLGGAGFAGDDFIGLEKRDGKLFGHSLFSTLMLSREQIGNFPALRAHAVRFRSTRFDKYLVPLHRGFGGQIRRRLEVDAIAVPRIVARRGSALRAGGKSAALRALAPTSVFASPWREASRAEFLLETATALPAMIYESGSELDRIFEPLQERYDF